MEVAAEAKLTSGRDTILQSLARSRRSTAQAPQFTLAVWTGDIAAVFIAKAKASAAFVHELASPGQAPNTIAEILRACGAAAELHIPPVSVLNALPWGAAEVSISPAPPTGTESAVSAADYGIAETGTLVFLSGANSPSSWHFRPGREFILIDKSQIFARFEDVIAQIGIVPATMNLITGPSRTADIEQTIEMGAHGPRELHILIA